MRRRAVISFAIAALAFVFGLAPAASAQSLRCNGHLVSQGDSPGAVVQACGEPSFRDPWIAGNGIGPAMAEWTYNFGPQQLIDVLLFRGDQVASIETEGYGFVTRPGFPPSGSCNPLVIDPGMSKYRLLKACGPPVSRSGAYVISDVAIEPGYRLYSYGNTGPLVFREVWIYNFGPYQFMRRVTLDDAVVIQVDTEKRGYTR